MIVVDNVTNFNENVSAADLNMAGIIPIAGNEGVGDFSFPWEGCQMPVANNLLAVEAAALECAYAGCTSVWVVAYEDMSPFIRKRLGEHMFNSRDVSANLYRSKQLKISRELIVGGRQIPIFYVCISNKDREKRDCLGWSVLYGAKMACNIGNSLSSYLKMDKYYVSFPFGLTSFDFINDVKAQRRLSNSKNVYFSFNKKTIADGEYLSFTFDNEQLKTLTAKLRKKSTGSREITGKFDIKENNFLPKAERYSARNFSLKDVFETLDTHPSKMIELPWYYDISTWDGLMAYYASGVHKEVFRNTGILP